jgi:uncharacterized SAM-binding protein YcdF (DUF218 family)
MVGGLCLISHNAVQIFRHRMVETSEPGLQVLENNPPFGLRQRRCCGRVYVSVSGTSRTTEVSKAESAPSGQAMTYLQPVFPLLLLTSLAVCILPRRTSRGRRILPVLISLGLVLWAWPPTAWLLSGSLEWWYRPDVFSAEPQVIVVLSGSVEGRELGLDHRLGRDSAVRSGYASWLHHRKWRDIPILVTGNRNSTKYIRAQLMTDGISQEMIWVEPQSASTADHAFYCARLLREKRIHKIALVTEAYHMLRSEACFRKQGFEVLPAPCAFRSATFGDAIDDWVPNTSAVRSNEHVAHEWVGLAYYWLRGYI